MGASQRKHGLFFVLQRLFLIILLSFLLIKYREMSKIFALFLLKILELFLIFLLKISELFLIFLLELPNKSSELSQILCAF